MRGSCSSFDPIISGCSAFISVLPPPPIHTDDAVSVSLTHHLEYQQMDSLNHGSTNLLRNAVGTIRILVNERREYLVGIILLLIVVFLWALSNFVTQVCAEPSPIPPYALLTVSLRCEGYFPRGIRETILVRVARGPAIAA